MTSLVWKILFSPVYVLTFLILKITENVLIIYYLKTVWLYINIRKVAKNIYLIEVKIETLKHKW